MVIVQETISQGFNVTIHSEDYHYCKDCDSEYVDRCSCELNKLEAQLEKATTMIVNHEAKMGYMKEALEKIRDDRSPQWDKTDFQIIARECLGMLFK